MRRHGFTLVELLVVVLVIGVLLGLVMAGLTLAKKAQQRTSTGKQLRDLAQAVSLYLDRSPLLPADFADRPWYWLTTAQTAAGRDPLFESPLARLAVRDGAAWRAATSAAEAEAIVDHIGGISSGVLRWTVTNDAASHAASRFTRTVRITSVAGTPAETADDVWTEWTIEERAWRDGKGP